MRIRVGRVKWKLWTRSYQLQTNIREFILSKGYASSLQGRPEPHLRQISFSTVNTKKNTTRKIITISCNSNCNLKKHDNFAGLLPRKEKTSDAESEN